jgi:hypothetical protein
VVGGLGVYENANVGGQLSVSSTTDSTSLSTGAVIISGGTAIQKTIRAMGNVVQGGTSSSNIMFYATYCESVYGSYGLGDLTPTVAASRLGIGAALNNNRLIVNNTGYVSYSAAYNADFTNLGAVRLMYTPIYNGTPATNMGIVSIGTNGDTENCLSFYHSTGGNLVLDYYNSAGILVANASKSWSPAPTAGTEYELAFLFDATAKVYINGVVASGPAVPTVRTTVTTLQVGSDVASRTYTSNCKIRNLVVYNNNPFGTGSYTPGYTLSNGYAFNTGSATLGYTLSAYNEYLLLTAFTGPYATTAVTIRLVILNCTVFLYCAGISNPSSIGGFFTSTTPIPLGFRPPENIALCLLVVNNSALAFGACFIDSAGIIYIYNGLVGFTSGPCGWRSFSANYTIA